MDFDSKSQDEEVAMMAVKALAAAQQRALKSGRPIVMVVNDELVRIDASGTTVLKKLPSRFKVTSRDDRVSQ